MTTRGAFITVEGGEGVGKSSSLAAIESWLKGRGLAVSLTREPGGTPLGETIRSWILEGNHGKLSAEVEALLMCAARVEHVDKVILPHLERGDWVVCDRFADATMAYQGGGRGADSRFLQTLAMGTQRGLQPDLTLLLDAPVSVGMSRIADRPHDHFEREESAFFERVRRTYLEIAAREPDRVRIIEASAPKASVRAAIERELDTFCSRFRGSNPR
jgi:dTMP kinase